MWSRYIQAGSLVVLCAMGACSPPPQDDPDAGVDAGPDIPAVSFESEIGFLAPDSGAFVPVDEAEYVEIVVGFQGLIFLELAIRAAEPVPDRFRGVVTVVFEDAPELNFDSRHNVLEFETVAGERVCRLLQLPFGQDLPLIDEQQITAELLLDAPGWTSESSARFLIADRLDCIQEPDGTMTCG